LGRPLFLRILTVGSYDLFFDKSAASVLESVQSQQLLLGLPLYSRHNVPVK
jgi:hypothetical protein